MKATSKAVKDMAVILDDMAETWKCGGVSMHADDCVLAAKMLRSLAAEREAAHDSLVALKKCAAVCAGEVMSKSGLIDALESARAAIAKAEGAQE